jgi:predicted RNase H-like nuclease (RuvC/YqgF family)
MKEKNIEKELKEAKKRINSMKREIHRLQDIVVKYMNHCGKIKKGV